MGEGNNFDSSLFSKYARHLALKTLQQNIPWSYHPKVQTDISSTHRSSKLINKSQSLFHCLVHWEFIPNTFDSFPVPADLSLSQAALLKHFSASMSEGTAEGGNSQLTRFQFLSSLSCEQDYI